MEPLLANYRWSETTPGLPPYDLPGDGAGRTHGVACLPDGGLVVFRQSAPSVLRFDAAGRLADSWGDHFGAHGLCLVEEGGRMFLWLTDQFTGAVEKRTLGGELVQQIPPPAHPVYETAKFVPTWVAVDEERFGGDGSLWLADGYGAQVVHIFDRDGKHRLTLDGTSGAGRFSCPHAVDCMPCGEGSRQFYIADRGNRRFQVYTPAGEFVRSFGDDFLTSPCCIAQSSDGFVVPELFGSLAILNSDGSLRDRLGENTTLQTDQPGWANRYPLETGKFNSPHAAAVSTSGDIYVVEWRVGGRIVHLEKTGRPA